MDISRDKGNIRNIYLPAGGSISISDEDNNLQINNPKNTENVASSLLSARSLFKKGNKSEQKTNIYGQIIDKNISKEDRNKIEKTLSALPKPIIDYLQKSGIKITYDGNTGNFPTENPAVIKLNKNELDNNSMLLKISKVIDGSMGNLSLTDLDVKNCYEGAKFGNNTNSKTCEDYFTDNMAVFLNNGESREKLKKSAPNIYAKIEKVLSDVEKKSIISDMYNRIPSEREADKVFQSAKLLPKSILNKVQKYGTVIDYINTNNLIPNEYDKRTFQEEYLGFYDPAKNLIYYKEKGISDVAVVLHEFAHAIDGMYDLKNDPIIKNCYEGAKNRQFSDNGERAGFISDYSKKNIGEYIAESISAYYIPEGYREKGLAKFDRGDLKKRDPAMFNALDGILSRIEKEDINTVKPSPKNIVKTGRGGNDEHWYLASYCTKAEQMLKEGKKEEAKKILNNISPDKLNITPFELLNWFEGAAESFPNVNNTGFFSISSKKILKNFKNYTDKNTDTVKNFDEIYYILSLMVKTDSKYKDLYNLQNSEIEDINNCCYKASSNLENKPFVVGDTYSDMTVEYNSPKEAVDIFISQRSDNRLDKEKSMVINAEKALKDSDAKILSNSKDEKALTRKGNALSVLKRYDEAVKAYDEAIRVGSGVYLSAYLGKAYTLTDSGQYEEALEAFDRAIEINHIAASEKGDLLLKLNRFEEALTAYEDAIERNPDYHELKSKKANALMKLNRNKEALKVIDEVLVKIPYYTKAQSVKIEIQEKMW